MKKLCYIFFLCLCLVHIAEAQTISKNLLLLNPSGNSVTLGTPASVTNNTILMPGTLGLQGALSYISSVAGSVGTTSWLNPGTSGFILSLSSGLPVWTDPASLFAGSYWSLTGNAPTAAYNGTTGSFLGTTNTQPLVLATTNTTTAQPIQLFTNNVERARIASTGELLLGTTTPLATLTVNGETYSNTFLTKVNTSKPAYAEGRFFYDSTEKTLAYYNDHNGVTLNVGQENWIRVRNVSGATIPNGVAVYITGSDAVTRCPTVGLARADLLTTADAIGITTESMLNNAIGYVTNFGVVHQLNTSAFTAGATLYLSAITAGMLTTTRPNQPNFTNPIGYCGVSDAVTGSVLVINAKTRQGAMTSGAVAIGGTDGFIKENPTNLFWDNTNLRLGIGTNTPSQSLEVKSGNVLLSNTGTAGQLQFQGTSTGLSTLQAGAQGITSFNYTLPITAPTANQVLTATAVAGSAITFGWANNAAAGGVSYNIASQQATATPRTNYLFNVGYSSGAANATAAGALITSNAGSGASMQDATGLTVQAIVNNSGTANGAVISATNGGSQSSAVGLAVSAVASGSGTSTGLTVTVSGGTTNTAAIFTGGNVGIDTTISTAKLAVNGETYSNTFRTQVNTSKPAYAEGRFFYDSTDKTLAYYNDHNGVTLNVGQESWIRVRNVSGATIPNGVAVYITGSDAVTKCPTVGLARADLLATADVIGITTESMANNAIGYVTNFGVVHQLNTSAFTAGATLYLSAITAGALTTTRPNQPNFTNPIGYCGVSDAVTGSVLVINGKTRNGSMTAGAVVIGGTDGFLKENPTNLFWDNTNLRLGIGTNTPTSPLTVTEPTTAASGTGIGALFNQTITAAANNDALYGIDVAPTFVNGAFTGLTNYAIRGLYAGTLTNGAAVRGKATGNGGANGEVIGVWGTASDATQGSGTNAGVGVKAEGNNTTTDANANIALQIVGGEFVVGRQAASAANVNVSGSNILAEDDANGVTDQGPSGVVDVTGGGLPAANSTTTGTRQIWNRYVKSNSIILLTGLDGGTGVLTANEAMAYRITARAAGTFTIECRRINPAVIASTGTAGTWRVGFLVVNPGK